jgi:hypothetical protein
MNDYYKQSVLGIGVAAPFVVLIALLGVVFHYKGNLEDTFKERKVKHASFKQYEQRRAELKKKVDEQAPHMVRWLGVMQEPASSQVNTFVSEAQKTYEGKEFQLTSFRRATASGGIGAASAQNSVQLELSFRGTYSALQNTFLELETKMPQLQLDRLSLIPQSNAPVLQAKMTYTAWERKQ